MWYLDEYGRTPGEVVCVIALAKRSTNERYVWVYREDQRADVLRSIGRFASNPDLSFTWYDAAVLSKRIREAEEA